MLVKKIILMKNTDKIVDIEKNKKKRSYFGGGEYNSKKTNRSFMNS
ncbi:hypothetical protein MHTCC0001_36780 [Flavobacteriaceae bacterium MHTCC 0001]